MCVKTAPDSRFQRRYVFGHERSPCRKELLASALLARLILTDQYCCMSFCMKLLALGYHLVVAHTSSFESLCHLFLVCTSFVG